MDIAITGSSGLIGRPLKKALREAGHRPIALVRRPVRGGDEIRYDPAAGELDAESLAGIGGVINLAGAGIGDKRWTASYKKLILDSRVDTTALVASTIAAMDDKPSVFLSGSAIGVYGDRGDTLLTEDSPPASSFFPDVVRRWEAAAQPAIDAGIRTTFLRTGIVLSPHSETLRRMMPFFKLGIGGKFGSGGQYWSWVSIDDVVAAIVFLLDSDITGPVNLTAPNPVTNAEFAKTLGRVLSRPAIIPVPKFGPALLYGSELIESLVFASARVRPTVLMGSGYRFQHPELEVALRDLLDRP